VQPLICVCSDLATKRGVAPISKFTDPAPRQDVVATAEVDDAVIDRRGFGDSRDGGRRPRASRSARHVFRCANRDIQAMSNVDPCIGDIGATLDERFCKNHGPAAAPTVLIVGAGPAGLFAACELLRHGVRPRVVERRLAPHHEARGTALQPAVLEMLERAGLIDPFLHAGVRIRHIQLLGPGLHEIAWEHFADTGCAYEFQCSLPQWRTEAILREHLESLGLEVEFGTEVTSIEDDPEGVRVALDTSGRSETVTAAYVLGAGGGHSITRHSMQEHLTGETYDGRYFVADVKVRLPCPPECGRLVVGPAGFVLFSPLPDDRWLIFVNCDEADTRRELPTGTELGTLLNAKTGVDVGLNDLRWVSLFKMHKRVVERLGDGRRFLLGDAAHLSSPLGGEGLNSSLMDAADIAWKLALVLRGAAKPHCSAATRPSGDLPTATCWRCRIRFIAS
jgi:2-polyprenyl-6-methoxyphenol hydroxylase-like FAD-dependent oxidoreductase